MPTADVVVVGAGLAGLVTTYELARRGAAVVLLAKGHASTHWAAGTLDVAALPRSATPRDGVRTLAELPNHPYAVLRDDVEPAVTGFVDLVERAGLPYVGGLDTPIRALPTGIGGTRPAAIVPEGMAAAMTPWGADEMLVLCGIGGFKDFWPDAVAASLSRPSVWQAAVDGPDTASDGPPGSTGVRPGIAPHAVVAVTADLPGLAGRHNLSAVHVARGFDDRAWRDAAIDAIGRAVDGAGVRGRPFRIGLPAVLGLDDHRETLTAFETRLGVPVFELPLVPPSVPGMRLFDVLRTAIRQAGGRIQLGESVSRVEVEGARVRLVATPAAVREFAVRTEALVIATGGLTGGGIVGQPDGRLEEVVLGLPVEAPSRGAWFAADALDPTGHPIEAAGVRTDPELRPVRHDGRASHSNVRVVGSLLAGQRWLGERCGEGVALASAGRAAVSLAAGGFRGVQPLLATADTTSSQVRARGGAVEPGVGPDSLAPAR